MIYDIADGFHRVDGIRRHDGPNEEVKVEALYNCTDEELYDLRIQAQTAMKGIKFARLATFMDGAWNSTLWKTKLTLAQAVKMTHNKSSGTVLGVEGEAEKIKEWVRKKAAVWMMDIVTLDINLRTIRAVNPELIKRVRLGGSFEKGKLSLTWEQLRILGAHIPQLFTLQEKIARFSSSHSLSTVEFSALVAEIAQVYDSLGFEPDDAKLQQIFSDGKWLTGLLYTGGFEAEKVYHLSHIEDSLRRLMERVKYSDLDQPIKEALLEYTTQISKHLMSIRAANRGSPRITDVIFKRESSVD